jgi:hypothetical protein
MAPVIIGLIIQGAAAPQTELNGRSFFNAKSF